MSKENLTFDLHCHTFHSDGTGSPSEMLEKANSLGLDYLAITDHNTTDGVIELIETGILGSSKTKVISGIELSLFRGHYLILGVDPYTLKEQLKKWGLSKGSFAEFVSYEKLQEYLRWSIDQGAFIIVAHPCMPTLLMSAQYSTLLDLQKKNLIHGAENNNHDVERHYGIIYGLYQQYVDGLLGDMGIPRFSNSDAHDPQYLGYYSSTANQQIQPFLDWVDKSSPFLDVKFQNK